MPLLQIPTTQFSSTIRELNWNKVIIFACCWPDSWVDRPRDRNYKICKFKNTYTQDNKQLFQIIGQIAIGQIAIEYRSFYLVMLLLAGSTRFWNINDSTRSRLDYIPIRIHTSFSTKKPYKNINWWTFAKILTVMCIFSPNADSTISNHIASDSPSSRIKS